MRIPRGFLPLHSHPISAISKIFVKLFLPRKFVWKYCTNQQEVRSSNSLYLEFVALSKLNPGIRDFLSYILNTFEVL
jgi:hypothetical protein